ncbi:MAG: M28 family peptidase [Candidatus Helarchaeota archaeon]
MKKLGVYFLCLLLVAFSFMIAPIQRGGALESFWGLWDGAESTSILVDEIGLLQFNATRAYSYIDTQLKFGFRVPGTPAHDVCASWINQTLRTHLDEVLVQDFTIQKLGQPAYYCQNLLGKLNANQSQIIILAAHWDSRAVAEKDSFNKTEPIPGANDGGSGVAVLLELARVLNQVKEELTAQIWFLFLDAEDQGESYGMYGLEGWQWSEGALAFNQALGTFYDSRNETINSLILLDMVGGTSLCFIDEAHSTNTLQQALFAEGQRLGYTNQFPFNPKSMTITDDHVPFLENGIPAVDLIIDFVNGPWSHHHKHSDNLANIDLMSLNITGRTIESFIRVLTNDGELPDWGDPLNNDLWGQWFWPLLLVGIFGGILILILLLRKKSELPKIRESS